MLLLRFASRHRTILPRAADAQSREGARDNSNRGYAAATALSNDAPATRRSSVIAAARAFAIRPSLKASRRRHAGSDSKSAESSSIEVVISAATGPTAV